MQRTKLIPALKRYDKLLGVPLEKSAFESVVLCVCERERAAEVLTIARPKSVLMRLCELIVHEIMLWDKR